VSGNENENGLFFDDFVFGGQLVVCLDGANFHSIAALLAFLLAIRSIEVLIIIIIFVISDMPAINHATPNCLE